LARDRPAYDLTTPRPGPGSSRLADRVVRVLLMVAMICLTSWGSGAFAASATATVGVTIKVESSASIDFPEGLDFLIEVPANKSPRGATIKPVRIPFTVTGSSLVQVQAAAEAYLQIADGFVAGRALGPDGGMQQLGYNIIVQFPVPSQNYSGLPGRGGFGTLPPKPNLASLPGNAPAPTPALTADAASKPQIYGTLHIVAEHNWTASGAYANPGKYRGRITVTLTTDNQ
jgi:hypothetical protein